MNPELWQLIAQFLRSQQPQPDPPVTTPSVYDGPVPTAPAPTGQASWVQPGPVRPTAPPVQQPYIPKPDVAPQMPRGQQMVKNLTRQPNGVPFQGGGFTPPGNANGAAQKFAAPPAATTRPKPKVVAPGASRMKPDQGPNPTFKGFKTANGPSMPNRGFKP